MLIQKEFEKFMESAGITADDEFTKVIENAFYRGVYAVTSQFFNDVGMRRTKNLITVTSKMRNEHVDIADKVRG